MAVFGACQVIVHTSVSPVYKLVTVDVLGSVARSWTEFAGDDQPVAYGPAVFHGSYRPARLLARGSSASVGPGLVFVEFVLFPAVGVDTVADIRGDVRPHVVAAERCPPVWRPWRSETPGRRTRRC